MTALTWIIPMSRPRSWCHAILILCEVIRNDFHWIPRVIDVHPVAPQIASLLQNFIIWLSFAINLKKFAKFAHNQKSFTYNHPGLTIILKVRGPWTRIPSEGQLLGREELLHLLIAYIMGRPVLFISWPNLMYPSTISDVSTLQPSTLMKSMPQSARLCASVSKWLSDPG